MATLKELRIRIRSVSSTQKITKAMKVVAASKLRRAREKAEAARPFAERMEGMLRSVRASMADSNASGTELLVGNGRHDTHLLVLVSSDRGLCGGLNNILIREARKLIVQLKAEGKKVKIIIHGKKANDVLKKEMKDKIIFQQDGMRDLSFQDAKDLAEQLITRFDDGEFDVCTVFYNHFASAISQKVTKQQLIPLPEKAEEAEDKHGGLLKPPYEYEPDEESIVRELLPRNLAVQIYHALLENGASEQGARMTAMDNATRNAGDMIGKLTLSYNRSRQAAITTELTEIISGAESL